MPENSTPTGILKVYKQAVKNVRILKYSWVLIATICILAFAAYFKLNNSDVFLYALAVIGISFIAFIFSLLTKTNDKFIKALLYILISCIVIVCSSAVLGFGSFIFWEKPEFFKRYFPNETNINSGSLGNDHSAAENPTPRRQIKNNGENNELSKIIEASSTKEEFKDKALSSKEIITDYLKQKSSYEVIDFAFDVKVRSKTIDMVAFYHYKQQTQIPHVLFLVKYHDVKPDSVKWAELDNDWALASNILNYNEIKTALLNTNGFNSPLEYPDPVGSGENVKPKVIYNQIYGRRSSLKQIDLGKMQQINSNPVQSNGIYRWVGTYDQIIDGLNFLAGSK